MVGEASQTLAFFKCGHFVCVPCFLKFVQHRRSASLVPCPICRQTTRHQDINYVNASVDRIDGIKEGYSSKIYHATQCVQRIHRMDPTAKILIFSEWQDVLKIMSHALTASGVAHAYGAGGNKTLGALSKFKEQEDMVCLLLPIRSAGNGLNLPEANHVILLEPSLNRGNELQAIGRVDRIGQTRRTTVHRFVMQGTVEEQILLLQELTTGKAKQGRGREQELKGLTVADFVRLFKTVDAVRGIPLIEGVSQEIEEAWWTVEVGYTGAGYGGTTSSTGVPPTRVTYIPRRDALQRLQVATVAVAAQPHTGGGESSSDQDLKVRLFGVSLRADVAEGLLAMQPRDPEAAQPLGHITASASSRLARLM